MSTSNRDQLQTLDLAALSQVSGGVAAPASATNDQILTALTGILDSIKTLAGQPNAGGFNQQEMLMMMMIMNRSQQQVAPPNPWTQEPIIRYY